MTALLNLVDVSFGHDGGRPLLAGVSFTLEKGSGSPWSGAMVPASRRC